MTLFLGINSLVYYVIIGWLPSILQSMGYSEAQAGSLHGLLQLATAAPGTGDTADPASAARPARDRGAGRPDVRHQRRRAVAVA